MENITCDMTPEKILEVVNSSMAVPRLVFLYLIFSVVFLLSGLLIINGSKGNKPYKKFMLIWFISIVIVGLILAFIIASPHTTQIAVDFIIKLW